MVYYMRIIGYLFIIMQNQSVTARSLQMKGEF